MSDGSPVSPAATPPASNNQPMTGGQPASQSGQGAGVDLRWVWMEVRKRVFIKLPFSLGVADAMEAIVPIALDDDTFVCGLSPRDYPLAINLVPDQVRNTIEGILRQAAGRYIRLEVIEGTSPDDWDEIKERRKRAQEAVIAMAEQQVDLQHYEDILNQIVAEIRQRITVSRDRMLPQVRAELMLDVIPSLADAEEMLFPDRQAHDSRRAMGRVIDRIAGVLEITPMMLAIEVERYRRATHKDRGAQATAAADTAQAPAEAQSAANPPAAGAPAPAEAPATANQSS